MWAFRKWLCAAIVWAGLALASAAPAIAGDSTVNGSGLAIPRTFFGMHIHRVEEPTPWPDSSVGALRTWDAKVRWADLEPADGRWDFSRLDRIVAGAGKRGIDVLVPLGMPAAWASARPSEDSAYKPGEAAPPKDMELWRRYVGKVAARYQGKVSTYEIWNEPNLKKFFSGTPADAATLTCEARRVLRTVAPGAKLVSPAPTGAYGVAWLKDFFAAGGGHCIDIVGFHFYNSHLDPETHLPILAQIRVEMAKAGISNLPVWTTETGWLIRSANRSISPDAVGFKSTDRVLSDDQSVSLVPRTLILHAAMGIGRFYWYALDNDMMGLFERDGTPKAVWRAYQDTARLLQGRLVGPCASSEAGIWNCDVKAPAGSVVARVRWLTTPLSERKLPIPQGVARYEVIGRGAVSPIDAQTAYSAGFVVIEWLNK